MVNPTAYLIVQYSKSVLCFVCTNKMVHISLWLSIRFYNCLLSVSQFIFVQHINSIDQFRRSLFGFPTVTFGCYSYNIDYSYCLVFWVSSCRQTAAQLFNKWPCFMNALSFLLMRNGRFLEDKTTTKAHWQKRALKYLNPNTLNLPCSRLLSNSCKGAKNSRCTFKGQVEIKIVNRIYEVQGSKREETTYYNDVRFLWFFSVT
jgi:hypothetical protein